MGEVDVMIQNVFMYTDSVICNGLILFFTGELSEAFSDENLSCAFLWRFYVLNSMLFAVPFLTTRSF